MQKGSEKPDIDDCWQQRAIRSAAICGGVKFTWQEWKFTVF